ncbi:MULTISPECIES: efflux transporter outer membrane subunit [unclassified Campylobacter]|uniref:efflux transporter outer membrane subunit n=1 Tax=unclassified Campylobacter TaxID=2593542 RepID=UPI003D3547E8
MRNLIIFLLALFMAGCSFRPSLPEVNATFSTVYESSDINDKWWMEFNDSRLNELVEQALKNNIDLKLAYINLQNAQLNLKNARTELLPTIGAEAGASRNSTSGETFSGQKSAIYNSFSLNAILNYEIDLWGRVRNSIASSNALLNASKFDYEAARIAIASSVANSYFSLVALKMQEIVYEETLKSYLDTMNYRKKQLDAGMITQIVYMQSLAATQSAQISLQNIKNSIITASNALAILTNKSNDEILYSIISSAKTLAKAPEINADISSDILLRRPDVASAYERLQSSNALIGVAKAAYFPKLSLTGLFGFSSDELERLFVSNANVWSIGGSLAQTLFDFGRRSNNVALAELAQSANTLNYEKTIKTALSEVRISLENRKTATAVLKDTKALLNSQNEIYNLANNQYNAGYVDHLVLLDAQRNLLSTRLSEIAAKLALNNATIEVYKSFGGGFKLQK